MTKEDKVRDLHNFFITEFKPKKPVILRFSKKMVNHGSYSYTQNKHYITLNKKDNYITLIDNGIHEWSHVLEHNKHGKEHHSDAWGVKFSRVYRAYLEWLDTK